MQAHVQFRLANVSDLQGVLDLYDEVCEDMIGTPHDCCWRRKYHPTDEFLEDSVRRGDLLVGCLGEKVVGAAVIDGDLGFDYGDVAWQTDATPDETAVIHVLAIRPGLRGRGLSKDLLAACLEEARRRGARTVRLDVTANNAPAIGLYKGAGFAHVGEGTQDVRPEGDPTVTFLLFELAL